MIYEFRNGIVLRLEHLPGRKKPVLVLTVDNEYKGHAVFSDEESMKEIDDFFMWAFGARENKEQT